MGVRGSACWVGCVGQRIAGHIWECRIGAMYAALPYDLREHVDASYVRGTYRPLLGNKKHSPGLVCCRKGGGFGVHEHATRSFVASHATPLCLGPTRQDAESHFLHPGPTFFTRPCAAIEGTVHFARQIFTNRPVTVRFPWDFLTNRTNRKKK